MQLTSQQQPVQSSLPDNLFFSSLHERVYPPFRRPPLDHPQNSPALRSTSPGTEWHLVLIVRRYGSLLLAAHGLGVPSPLVHDSLIVRWCDHIPGRISLSADETLSSSHMPICPLRLTSTPIL